MENYEDEEERELADIDVETKQTTEHQYLKQYSQTSENSVPKTSPIVESVECFETPKTIQDSLQDSCTESTPKSPNKMDYNEHNGNNYYL